MILDSAPVPVFRHLNHLTDACGLVEEPTARHPGGYTVDDAAHALVVVCREPRPAPNVAGLSRRYLDFVSSAVAPDGRCRNRMSTEQMWTDEPALGDWWGRALWGLGTAATSAETGALQGIALDGFRRAAKQRSPQRHAMAYAALGAAEILRSRPDDTVAVALLGDAVQTLWWDEDQHERPWPEPRLGPVNAVLAEAMLVGGELLSDDDAYSRGLEMLQFLLDVETDDDQLSVTPVGGRGPGERPSGGDQLPGQVAAIADACAAAYRITREHRWSAGVKLAWRWFLGANDASTPMFDRATGAGFDSLAPDGRSDRQGAEATLAALSTAQHARRLLVRR